MISSAITIAGQGGTIARASSAPEFRLLAVNDSGDLTLQEVTLTGGVVSRYQHGGGVANFSSTVTIEGCTISGNTGGGVLNAAYYGIATLTVIHSTITGNSGFGVYNAEGIYGAPATVTLTQSTITGNTATDGGGGVVNAADEVSRATLVLAGSLVAGNLAPTAPEVLHSGGTLTANAFNLFGVSGTAGVSGFTPGPTDVVPSEPLTAILAPVLADHGGPTLTHALVSGSPAIDAIPWGTNGCGTTLISDQRERARPQPAGGPCDIGAYEVEVAGQALGAWVTGVTPQTVSCTNVTTGQSVTLNAPATSWDCEAAGLAVTPGDRVAMRVRGPVDEGATDVGGAVVGMTPSSGGCTGFA